MGKAFQRVNDRVAQRKQPFMRGRGIHTFSTAMAAHLLELSKFLCDSTNADAGPVDPAPLLESHRDFVKALEEFLG